MPTPQLPADKGVQVSEVKGLNERLKFSNPDSGEFDSLIGLIPQQLGNLQRINGTKFLQYIAGKRILNIYQTFDRRENCLVQTDQGVYLFSEDELLNRVVPTNLTPVTEIEEENMSQAVIIDSRASGTNGGSITATTWTDAPLSAILYQLNPDGTAASFVTALAANIFTLAVGGYRFRIRSICADDGTGTTAKVLARLFNVTSGLPAWSGLNNEVSGPCQLFANNINSTIFLGGELELTVPTQFKIQHYASQLATNVGFGFPLALSFRENYRWIEITQTHT